MSLLYRTEFKSIQSWLLATDKLREIVGGSDAIEEFVEEARGRLEGVAEVISAAAGGITVRFPSVEGLAQFAGAWPWRVDRALPGLPMVQAWVDLGDRTRADPADWDDLRERLAAARNRVWPELPHAGPLVARAGRSGGPAVARGAAGLADRAMLAKEERVHGSPSETRAADRLSRKLLPDGNEWFVEDVDGLGEGYVAVVHIDANGVGERLQSRKDIDPHSFSDALAKATLRAPRSAIRDAVGSRMEAGPRPGSERVRVRCARLIVLGGDDFTVLCRGEDGLKLSAEYLRAFEEETTRASDKLGGSGLRACAGVALARPGWPFAYAHDLAEGLCRAAKGHCKPQGLSGLAFHRVTASLASHWSEIRAGELTRFHKGCDYVLTANPYTMERWELLGRAADSARRLPRGSLRRWVTLAAASPGKARRHWDRMREVADKDDWAAFATALRDLDCDPATGWSDERQEVGAVRDERRTPVPDVVELLAVLRADRSSRRSRP